MEKTNTLSTPEHFYRLFFDRSPVGIFSMTESGHLLQINEAMAALLDCNEPCGKNILVDLFADNDDLQRFVKQLAQTGSAKNCSLQRKTKDGQTMLLGVEAFCLDTKGTERVIEGFVSDITPFQKKLKNSGCPAYRQHIREKPASVRLLAGNVAHELNNMLSVMLGYTEMLLDDPYLFSYCRSELEGIRGAAQRSAAFTARLMAYAGIQIHSPRIININKQIEHRLASYEEVVGNGIQVLWYPEKRLWNILLDPAQLDELFTIFCTNAHDAMKGFGTLTISTSNRHVKYQSEELPAGDYVNVVISDEGSGMSQKVLDHLYKPFFTTKNLGDGIGLGLATALEIVRQNSGYLAIKSIYGEGTSVILHFPAVCDDTEGKQNEG
ncbi:two-component system sensor histidine kinase NtrB [Desulfogranum marinum]|uniref:two-component system sensor histidine kinase NtrB n=1 Tax=Desulfogranum marinum TaxID=453220 RepID=UPI0019635C6E|nr:ATP-binding protein [Desulfogranum marinum]MBM9514893.1 PAS domain S-box protein [Desulfogranum marinum]